jgi:hypothetical protein
MWTLPPDRLVGLRDKIKRENTGNVDATTGSHGLLRDGRETRKQGQCGRYHRIARGFARLTSWGEKWRIKGENKVENKGREVTTRVVTESRNILKVGSR